MLKKIPLIILTVSGLSIAGLLVFIVTFEPARQPASTESVTATPARLEHGRYLFEHQLMCSFCHTKRDWGRFGGPAIGPVGAGGLCLTPEMEFPGTLCASNLTSDMETGLGAWSDGEIIRAIREGIARDGRGLLPVMPYEEFRHLSDEDTASLVVFLRSLEPVSHAVPVPEIDFPASFFMKMAPQPVDGPVPEPDRADPVSLGRYLTMVGSCHYCHTPIDAQHKHPPGTAFGGGHVVVGPWGTSVSANLTPHETGLGGRSEENFIATFRSFQGFQETAHPVETGNTAMPWILFADLEESELKAIYAYLRTIEPLETTIPKKP